MDPVGASKACAIAILKDFKGCIVILLKPDFDWLLEKILSEDMYIQHLTEHGSGHGDQLRFCCTPSKTSASSLVLQMVQLSPAHFSMGQSTKDQVEPKTCGLLFNVFNLLFGFS